MILSELRAEAVCLLMQVVDYVVQLASPPLYQAILVDTGLFRSLVASSFDPSVRAAVGCSNIDRKVLTPSYTTSPFFLG